MADNDGKSSEFVSKSDLQVMMATFEQKMTERETSFKKELETQSNQIHSSYAKKLKKLGMDTSSTATSEEDPEDVSPTSGRKPSKRELELQTNIEKLVKEMEDTKTRAKQAERRQTVTDQLLKSGVNPKAVDTVYTLFNARDALVEAEDGSLKLKVNVGESASNVALPLTDALKHFMQSDEGQIFQTPLGTNGSGGKTPAAAKTSTDKDIPAYRKIDVDWAAVSDDMKWSP
jgi:signal recognition particle GTPase